MSGSAGLVSAIISTRKKKKKHCLSEGLVNRGSATSQTGPTSKWFSNFRQAGRQIEPMIWCKMCQKLFFFFFQIACQPCFSVVVSTGYRLNPFTVQTACTPGWDKHNEPAPLNMHSIIIVISFQAWILYLFVCFSADLLVCLSGQEQAAAAPLRLHEHSRKLATDSKATVAAAHPSWLYLDVFRCTLLSLSQMVK